MSEPQDYGDRYFCVELATGDSIYLHADSVLVKDGDLTFAGSFQGGTTPKVTAAFARGYWTQFFAVSQLTGGPVAVNAIERAGEKGAMIG